MVTGQALAIAVAVALTVFVAQGVVAGAKKVGHGIKHVAAKVIHKGEQKHDE